MDIETVSNGPGSETAAPTQEAAAPAVAEGSTGGDKQGREAGAVETPAEQRHRIKYGKNERELSTDELKVLAQKGWAADDRFQQASKIKKEVEDLVKQANWDKLIEKQTGKSPIEFYKERLKAELRRQAMTPEEREEAERRSRVDSLKQEELEIIQRREEEKIAKAEEHYTQQWDKELAEAIEKEGLPKNRYALNRAIQIGKKVVDMGLDPDWGLVVKEAKAQIQEDLKGLMGAFKDDAGLLGLFGDEMAMRISKALVAKKNPAQQSTRKAVESSMSDSFRQKEPKQVDVDAWIAERRKKFEEG